jgi:hypothetical protein
MTRRLLTKSRSAPSLSLWHQAASTLLQPLDLTLLATLNDDLLISAVTKASFGALPQSGMTE